MALTTAGLTIPSLEDLRADFVQRCINAFGAKYNDKTGGAIQTMGDTLLTALSEAYELVLADYDARNRDVAEGAALNNLGVLVGVTRLGATKSTVTITCSGTPNTVIAAGSQVRVPETDVRFETLAEATIPDTGEIDVECQALEYGPLTALSTTITEIVTPVSGWEEVANDLDALPGRDEESDPDYRRHIEASFQGAGAATEKAIRAALLELTEVQAALVISNRTSTTDGNGMPPKSVQAVIYPNTVDAATIAEVMYNNLPAGIESYGTQSATVTDAQDYSQTVEWSWATEVALYVKVDVETNNKFPVDGATQIRDIILELGAEQEVGEDVIIKAYEAAIFTGVTGIVDFTLKIDTVNPPVNTSNVTMSIVQIAKFDSSRITVMVA